MHWMVPAYGVAHPPGARAWDSGVAGEEGGLRVSRIIGGPDGVLLSDNPTLPPKEPHAI